MLIIYVLQPVLKQRFGCLHVSSKYDFDITLCAPAAKLHMIWMSVLTYLELEGS